MSRSSRRLVHLFGCLFLAVISGCSPPTVQEDRSINYSAEGSGVAFQHGDEGVFIASSDGQSLQQIHESADALAVSSPLWSPVDDRLIFTTAHPAEPDDEGVVQPLAAWDANPEGRRFVRQPVVYTCWLREATANAEPSQPSPIFTARCDHPGYIAANLAVRWHPSGEKILFLDQEEEGGVGLFEFDLHSASKRRLIEHRAGALIFDWSPNHKYLTCSLLDVRDNKAHDGIWVRSGEDSEWWQVPNSALHTLLQDVDGLEQLRRTTPAWTADDQHFAFVAEHYREHQVRKIFRVTPASQTATQLYETESVIQDLRWQPNSRRLAFVDTADDSLRIIDESGEISDPVNEFDIRRFVGWNHDGSKLAYISPEPLPPSQSEWMLLFPAVAGARDRVYMSDGETGGTARLVHGDVRITFPQWSPTRDELSLWGTYAPTHVSLLSMVLPWTLRPGDPAAILDCATGEMRWMAVNSHERSQVGHYYLLKRDYERAWHWYEKAAKDRPTAEPIKLTDLPQVIQQRRVYQNPMFFEFYCLHKLGREAEAEQRLKEFRRSMTFEWEETDLESWGLRFSTPEAKAQLNQFVAFLTPVLQSVYMTEVFLSLDAAEDGAKFFQRQMQAASTDAEKFASLVCLSQLLLASKDYEAYADLITHQLAPLWARLGDWRYFPFPQESGEQNDWLRWAQQGVVAIGSGSAALPMASSEFTKLLSERQCRRLLEDWEAFGEDATSDEMRLAADLAMHALLRRLDDGRQDEVRRRIAENPVVIAQNEEGFPDVDRMIQEIRDFSTGTISPTN